MEGKINYKSLYWGTVSKMFMYVIFSTSIISCTNLSQFSDIQTDTLISKKSIDRTTVVNQKALDNKDILYCGDGYGMTPQQAFKKAKTAALIEMASSVATFVISNSSQGIYDNINYSNITHRLRDKIYNANIIMDHQVVKYEEFEEYGGYRCKVFLAFKSEASRIVASERSEKLLQDIISDVTRNSKGVKLLSKRNLDDICNDINFSKSGISKKEISNLIFSKYITRLSNKYKILCVNDTIFLEDIPLAYGFHIKNNSIVPKRFTENSPVLATPIGINIFLKILNNTYYSADKDIAFSLLSVKDYYSIYNDLGVRPYLTDYVYKDDPEEPNIKFVMKFFSKRIEIKNTLMEFYSTKKNFANFFIKINH